MGDFSGRLSALLKAMGLNANKLASEIGGTTAKYYKLLNGATDPQFSTVQAILEKYPIVSAEWLTRGEGDMFLTEDEIAARSVRELMEENQKLKKQAEVFEEKYFDLKNQVGKDEAATESLLNDHDAEEANRLLKTVHISALCAAAIEILKAEYGFGKFPSIN